MFSIQLFKLECICFFFLFFFFVFIVNSQAVFLNHWQHKILFECWEMFYWFCRLQYHMFIDLNSMTLQNKTELFCNVWCRARTLKQTKILVIMQLLPQNLSETDSLHSAIWTFTACYNFYLFLTFSNIYCVDKNEQENKNRANINETTI